jgi:O-antigen ligase
MAINSPLLGAGAGHFPITYGQFFRSSTDIPWQTAHSIYFLTLGELGLPGLALLLTFIFSNLAANRRALREIGARSDPMATTEKNLLVSMSASLIAFATSGAFLSATYYPHMYMLAGLMVSARRVVRERALATSDETALAQRQAADVAVPVGSTRISPHWKPRAELGAAQSERHVRRVK